MTSRRLTGLGLAAIFATGLLGAAPFAQAQPYGPGDPDYCGAHTSPFDCWNDVGPTTPGEATFINKVQSYHIAGVPTDSTRLLQIARGACQELAGGTDGNYIVADLQESLGGIRESAAGNLLIIAQEYAC